MKINNNLIRCDDNQKCGRCKKNKKKSGEYVCKQCADDEKTTQWGRG